MSAYLDTLYDIQQEQSVAQGAKSNLAILPYAARYYDVNLETRKIETPEFLSVSKDHKAENVYFRMNRYFDYMDLSTLTCVIQYINAKGEPHIYAVPYFDIYTFNGEDKMVIPWNLDGHVSAGTGAVQFSIRFYKLKKVSEDQISVIYNLNTLPASSKIMYGLDIQDPDMNGEYELPATAYDELVEMIQKIGNKDIYWLEYLG